VFEQITRTIPFRRTILQFSQIRLTLLRTFMASLANCRGGESPKKRRIDKDNRILGQPQGVVEYQTYLLNIQ